jgi:hypothetical protein
METYNYSANYLLEKFMLQFKSIEKEEKESIMVVVKKQVEEVKMLSNKINEPLLDLDKDSLNELY